MDFSEELKIFFGQELEQMKEIFSEIHYPEFLAAIAKIKRTNDIQTNNIYSFFTQEAAKRLVEIGVKQETFADIAKNSDFAGYIAARGLKDQTLIEDVVKSFDVNNRPEGSHDTLLVLLGKLYNQEILADYAQRADNCNIANAAIENSYLIDPELLRGVFQNAKDQGTLPSNSSEKAAKKLRNLPKYEKLYQLEVKYKQEFQELRSMGDKQAEEYIASIDDPELLGSIAKMCHRSLPDRAGEMAIDRLEALGNRETIEDIIENAGLSAYTEEHAAKARAALIAQINPKLKEDIEQMLGSIGKIPGAGVLVEHFSEDQFFVHHLNLDDMPIEGVAYVAVRANYPFNIEATQKVYEQGSEELYAYILKNTIDNAREMPTDAIIQKIRNPKLLKDVAENAIDDKTRNRVSEIYNRYERNSDVHRKELAGELQKSIEDQSYIPKKGVVAHEVEKSKDTIKKEGSRDTNNKTSQKNNQAKGE